MKITHEGARGKLEGNSDMHVRNFVMKEGLLVKVFNVSEGLLEIL